MIDRLASGSATAMFESTLPFGEPELMRASAFRRYLDESARSGEADSMASRLSTLSPSLMLDLMRFEQEGQQGGVIEILAACIRHARKLLIHLQVQDRVVPLTVFPVEHLVHCPMPMAQFLALPLGDLSVLHVEPALLRPPGDRVRAMVGEPQHYSALGAAAVGAGAARLARRAAAGNRRPGGLPHLAGAEPAHPRAQRLDGRGGGAAEARHHQPARDGAVARLRPRARDAPAQRAVPAGRPDGQPHAPGGHQRRLEQRAAQ